MLSQATYICTLTKVINVIFPFLSKRFLSFLNIDSYPRQLRNPEYLRGITSFGQQQNAIEVTFHSPADRDNSFDTLGLIYSVFVHINLGVLGLPVSGWHFVYTIVFVVIYHKLHKLPFT